MKRGVAALGALLVVLIAPGGARAADESAYAHLKWRSIGPAVAGGRVAAVAGTPANPQLYYIGAAGGGV